jgi:heme-degrading monooxygenase HmoA
MYTRLVIVQVKPDKLDELVRIYSESIVPAAKAQKGCQGVYLLLDRNTGKGISEVMWDTEADMKAGETSGYLREQIAKAAPTFTAPPTTEHYEVVVRG